MPKPQWTASRDRLLLVAFGVVLLGFGGQGLTDSDGSLRSVQDHTITLSFSRQLALHHEYHPDFVYPLPAAILKLALGAFGTNGSSLAWMAVLIASGLLAVHAMALLLAPSPVSSRYAAPLLGALVIVYCLQWDYRAVNVNTALLALVLLGLVELGRGREIAAGALLALSAALKLYSAPLFLYLAWIRRPRALGSAIVGSVVLFVFVPVLWFGVETAVELTGLFLAQLQTIASPTAVSEVTAYDVSLLRAVGALIGEVGDAPSAAAQMLSRGLALVFCAAVVFWIGRGGRRGEQRDGPRLLTDVGLMFAAMLMLSRLAQPHHGVLLWPLAAVTARLMLDASEGVGRRGLAAAILLGVGLGLVVAPSGAGKAVALNLSIVLLAIGGVVAAGGSRLDGPPVGRVCCGLP